MQIEKCKVQIGKPPRDMPSPFFNFQFLFFIFHGFTSGLKSGKSLQSWGQVPRSTPFEGVHSHGSYAARLLIPLIRKANVLGLFGDAARGVIVAILSLISVAGAQTVAPLKLTVPQEHPRIGITAADLDRV